MNGLLLHSGGTEVTPEELAMIPTPRATDTWTPIPHASLLSAVRNEMTGAGLVIERESLAVSNVAKGSFGDRFFGLLEMRGDGEVFSVTVGIRNGHDRSIVAGLCVGSRVFVCSNLAFSAEVVIARRHTKRIEADLPRLINQAVGRLGDLRQRQGERIDAYRRTEITDGQFHDLTIRAMDSGVICASKIPKVLQEYRNPEHEEFTPRTVWSGFNAFTEVLKGTDLQDLPRRTTALHGLCDLLGRVN